MLPRLVFLVPVDSDIYIYINPLLDRIWEMLYFLKYKD